MVFHSEFPSLLKMGLCYWGCDDNSCNHGGEDHLDYWIPGRWGGFSKMGCAMGPIFT